MNRVRDHLRKHREAYIVGGLFVIAGITYLIVKDNFGEKIHLNGYTDCEKLHINGDTGFINQGTITDSVVNVFERAGRGHPGYMIKCIENGLTYLSQKKAAIALGINQTELSDHLNGRAPHVHGYHFERVHLA